MASPILLYEPGGGVSGGPISNPPVYSQADTTALIEGQAYIDIVFSAVQTDEDWVLVACEVENTTDFEPLNIWPGIITDKTTAGFRLQLNGMPDSGNYYLRWAVSGVNITPVPATSYQLLGSATSGAFGIDVTFTVKLFPSTTLGGSVVVTPDDGGDGGVFTPTSVTLTAASPIKTFTYSPASFGAKTISVTNDNILTDPASVVYTVEPVEYALAGPSGGDVGSESTNFHVFIALESSIPGTVTVTPDDGGAGGVFTPATVDISDSSRDAYFTYNAAMVGGITISVTNDGGLIDPDPLTYTATPAALGDGDPVSTWMDSSGNGNDATMTGSNRPTFKTAIVNGLPVVRFTSAGFSKLNLTTPIEGNGPWTVIMVAKRSSNDLWGLAASSDDGAFAPFINGTGAQVYYGTQSTLHSSVNTMGTTAFHVLTIGVAIGGAAGSAFFDGTGQADSTSAVTYTGDFDNLGWSGGNTSYSDGDIAEIIIYNQSLVAGDHANIEKYLGDKYAITVAAGSAVDPSTVTGLAGWWKADSL